MLANVVNARFKAQKRIPLALFSVFAITSCAGGLTCQVDGKQQIFQSSSASSVEDFVRVNHSSFMGIEGEKRLSVDLAPAKEGTKYSLYLSKDTSLKMELKQTAAESFVSDSYPLGSLGRRYLVISYEDNGKSLYAGYAFGYPEADPAVLSSLLAKKPTAIEVKDFDWSGSEYVLDREYHIESQNSLNSFANAFKDSFLIHVDSFFPRQVPGESKNPSYYEITLQGSSLVSFILDANSLMVYEGQRYGVYGEAFASWLKASQRSAS